MLNSYYWDEMIELEGDIWDYLGLTVIAITTNGSVTRDGRGVLGRGVAAQAQVHFPDLRKSLGALILSCGNHVHLLGEGLVSFPVEETAWSLPDPSLISRSCRELRSLVDREGWQTVMVPRPGCGGGGLIWRDVRPLLEAEFDNRFRVIFFSP